MCRTQRALRPEAGVRRARPDARPPRRPHLREASPDREKVERRRMEIGKKGGGGSEGPGLLYNHFGAVCPHRLGKDDVSYYRALNFAVEEITIEGCSHKSQWVVAEEGEEYNPLNLNVFFPKPRGDSKDDPAAAATNSSSAIRYPVVVFVFGGAFLKGSPAKIGIHGIFTQFPGAVVVTTNYRYGPFGFLNRDADGPNAANLGVTDVLVALRFVKRYIEHFHGDPHNITLIGESAGAGIVKLLALELFRRREDEQEGKLFHRIMLMSGFSMEKDTFEVVDNRRAFFEKLIALKNSQKVHSKLSFTYQSATPAELWALVSNKSETSEKDILKALSAAKPMTWDWEIKKRSNDLHSASQPAWFDLYTRELFLEPQLGYHGTQILIATTADEYALYEQIMRSPLLPGYPRDLAFVHYCFFHQAYLANYDRCMFKNSWAGGIHLAIKGGGSGGKEHIPQAGVSEQGPNGCHFNMSEWFTKGYSDYLAELKESLPKSYPESNDEFHNDAHDYASFIRCKTLVQLMSDAVFVHPSVRDATEFAKKGNEVYLLKLVEGYAEEAYKPYQNYVVRHGMLNKMLFMRVPEASAKHVAAKFGSLINDFVRGMWGKKTGENVGDVDGAANLWKALEPPNDQPAGIVGWKLPYIEVGTGIKQVDNGYMSAVRLEFWQSFVATFGSTPFLDKKGVPIDFSPELRAAVKTASKVKVVTGTMSSLWTQFTNYLWGQ